MNNKINESISKRILFIDFDLYAENDPDFKQELIELMIDNLQELQQAYDLSAEQHEPVFFLKACHKVKTTLSMLADVEFNVAVEDLKNPGVSAERISLFKKLSGEIIISLLTEKS